MSTKVRDVMSAPVITAQHATPFKHLAGLLGAHRIGALPVTDPDGHVMGVVSESDLLLKESRTAGRRWWPMTRRRRREHAKAAGRSAGELMTAPAVTITPDATIAQAARLMQVSGVHHLPVVDPDGHAVGMVSRGDLLRVFARSDETIRHSIVDGLVTRYLWMDPEQLQVQVNDGLVSLRGKVEARSLVGILVRLVEELDGVVAVDHDLTWDFDDTRTDHSLL